jgi:hypothetical protein
MSTINSVYYYRRIAESEKGKKLTADDSCAASVVRSPLSVAKKQDDKRQMADDRAQQKIINRGERREKNSPRRCTEIHGFFNHEGHEEREENTRLTADGRRQTQTIRIRWKLYDELLAAKNKRASSYPPTALVSTQILGCLRYAECFQVILHTLPPTIMFE